VAIVCPHCRHALNLKNPKPGRYTPKCTKCGKPFTLTVSDGPEVKFIVGPVPSAPGKAAPKKPAAPPQRGDSSPTAPLGASGPSAPQPPPRPPLEETIDSTPDEPPPRQDDKPSPHALTPPPLGETIDSAPDEAPPPGLGESVDSTPEKPLPKSAKRPAADDEAKDMPDTLGGYQVLKELGRGGMGAVYLARQVSLDRQVALKVMRPKWASNPTFMARFTREAYAAAQLVHHNVVQIYDLGSDRDVQFFSMEFVVGRSLGDLVKKDGKLDVELAVGYALQAARGLKFGHDRGMIHRDIKPDNLLISDQGVVKVADLGLVKTPGTTEPVAAPDAGAPAEEDAGDAQLTRANTAIGTPAYMAPEQARDSAHVDPRADIYSLGCTLYVLVTGRPPFQGKTILELFSKHALEPMVPPEVIVKRVPKALSSIILKMTAKKPEDRYADMGEVVQALEAYLGVESASPFTPREEHANLLEECVGRFNAAPTGRLRSLLALGFLGGCVLLMLLCLLLRWWLPAVAFAGLALLTPVCYFVVHGFTGKTYLFGKVRELVLDSRWTEWLTWLAGGLLGVLVLYLLMGFWFVLVVGLALGLGLAFHFVVDRRLAAEQAAPVAEVEKMLRTMRLRGLEEDALRQFVCKYAGHRWEAFYEALFGYEAKLSARTRWVLGEQGRGRQKHGAWREPAAGWIDTRLRARQEARERRHLQAVEEKRLKAEGVGVGEARARAEQAAEVLVEKAAQVKAKAARRAAAPQAPAAVLQEERELLNAATVLSLRDAPATTPVRRRGGPITGLFGLLFGARMRFLVGAVLLVGCLLWVRQNSQAWEQDLKKLADQARAQQTAPDMKALQEQLSRERATKPLELPLVPAVITGLFDSFNPGVAGLLLVLSAFFRGPRVALFCWPAAVLAFAGPRFGVPSVGPVTAHQLSMAAGVVLAVPGFLFHRRKEAAG
jgi:serine/threonine protein kinase